MAYSEDDVDPQFTDLIGLISSEARWPELEQVLRRATQTVADEWTKRVPSVKVDVRSMIKELGTAPVNVELQHFFTWNHRFVAMLSEKNRRAAVDTFDFVDRMMPNAMFNLKQMDVIASRKDEIMRLGGSILDLGVYKGSSTRQLAKIFPNATIHGFDSFEGLPGDWSHALKGTFGDMRGILPDMPENVKLYKGWFDETLPPWLEHNGDKPISLLRVDSDIYSSAKTIFDVLGGLVKSGTWIVFDELIGYRGFKEHEYKAFREFQDRTGIEFEYVAFGLAYAMGFVK